LDPETRYKDMREVLGAFEHIDEERHLRDERDRVRLLRQREEATLRSTRILALTMGAGFVVATLTAMVQANRHRVAARDLADLKTRYANMLAEKEAEAHSRESSAKQRVDSARAQAAGAVQEAAIMKETLVLSQEQADQLFAIVQDRKPVTHPGFKDHAKTAAELKAFYEGFVAKVGKQSGMEVECARATDNLADLARGAGDREAALRWQGDAVRLWDALAAKQPSHRTRLARALLCQAQGQFQANDLPAAARSLKRCRELFESMEREHPGDEAVQRQLAACYLLQGRIERQSGHADNALALYRAAIARLQTLTEKTGRFDYRSEMAAGYIEMGELARGIDDLEKAANVQRAALGQLVSMVEEKPEMRIPKLDLARAYGELGEIECQAGNPEQGFAMLGKSLDILNALATEDPSSTDVLYQKAVRLSAMARSYRDEGKRGESEKLAGQAHDILAKLAASREATPAIRYQYALVLWQRAEIQGDLSQLDASMATMRSALEILQDLDRNRGLEPAMQRPLRVSMAYLTGDLGHGMQESKRRADALKYFQSSVKQWQDIAATYGNDDTIAGALAWSQRRLAELQAP
jgi:tetratricopeptide (TPR) repeat protein